MSDELEPMDWREARGPEPESASRIRFLAPEPHPVTPPSGFGGIPPSPGSDSAPSVTFGLASGSRVEVTFSPTVCRAIMAHCSSSNIHGREVGGILVGYHSIRAQSGGEVTHHTFVSDIIPVDACDASQAHVCFDAEHWAKIDAEMTSVFAPEGKVRLGWYHTHPTQGIFFSPLDVDAHSVFRQEYQFALVVDPRSSRTGLFYWANRDASELAGPLEMELSSKPRIQDTGEQPHVRFGSRSKRVRFPGFVQPLTMGVLALLFIVAVPYFWTSYRSRGHVETAGNLRPPPVESGERAPGSRPDSTPAQAAPVAPERKSLGVPYSPGSAGAAVKEKPAATDASESSTRARRTVHVSVRLVSRSGNSSVMLNAPNTKSALAYNLRECRYSGGLLKGEACTVRTGRKQENAFFASVFRWRRGTRDAKQVRALQSGLGLRNDQADGLWGPQSRLALVRRALASETKQPLTVRSASNELNVVFEQVNRGTAVTPPRGASANGGRS
jgi:proteasome lid subunit RPN8/RPN11